MEAIGKIVRYEVTHKRDRQGYSTGHKTRIVIDIPRDVGEEVAELKEGDLDLALAVLQAQLPA